MAEQPYYLNNSVARTMQILEYLAFVKEAGISQVAANIGENKVTTHRFLASMKYAGFVGQNLTNKKYYLAAKMFEIGQTVERTLELRSVAHPFLEELWDYTCGTIVLGILENKTEVVFVDYMQSKKGLFVDPAFGLRSRAHATSTGKALFAFSDPAYFESYVAKYGLRAMTPGTITDKDALISLFETIREQGYALDDEGAIIWVKAVAAPIFDVQNNLLAAVSVSVPKIQDQLEKFDSYIEATKQTARKISQAFYECRLKPNDGPQK